MTPRPPASSLTGASPHDVPMSLQRLASVRRAPDCHWIGPKDAVTLARDVQDAYHTAHQILIRLCIEAPLLHQSGHPGGPLSAFTAAYEVMRRRDPAVDEPLRMSPGHLSLLGYALQWFFGRDRGDARLASPEAILQSFRTPDGLPGHIEAGIGDIPFGTGPLGKGVSNALGVALGKRFLGRKGVVDVLLADGDSQEGQVIEAFRLAAALTLDTLVVHGDWNDVQLSGMPSTTVAADFAAIAAACGWSVIEVQNGNDQCQVAAALDLADTLVGKGKPIFICYYTTMGYGVPLMEEGANTGHKNFHGAPLTKEEAHTALQSLDIPSLSELTTSFDPVRHVHKQAFDAALRSRVSARLPFSLPAAYTRTITTKPGAARKDFGAVHLKALMEHDPRIVVLHADLADSGGFGVVAKAFPDRVINVGVAEANMAMMAAGMRQAGLLPVTYTFAAFGTNEARANVRLIDVNTGHVPLGVLHDCTHAGLSVGEDGETHQERNYVNLPFDHTRVWVAGDSNQAAAMAERAMAIIAEGSESVFVFAGRSNHAQLLTAHGAALYDATYTFDERATVVRGHGDQRDSATILSYGSALHEAVAAADLLRERQRTVRVLNVASLRPLDAAAVVQAALETQHLIVAEDHNTEGGLATQIADLLSDLCVPCTLRRIGVRSYFPSAPAPALMVMAGLDAQSIADVVEDQFSHRLAGGEDVFVSFLYGLSERLPHTRFAASIAPYLERLRSDEAYLRTLRELWKSRKVLPKDLPANAELLQRLPELPPPSTNPLTGMPRSSQHDCGILTS